MRKGATKLFSVRFTRGVSKEIKIPMEPFVMVFNQGDTVSKAYLKSLRADGWRTRDRIPPEVIVD